MKFHESEFNSYVTIDFNPHKYKTVAGAAKGLYKALCKKAAEYGQNPEKEVAILTPYESLKHGTGDNWRVMWEAGPYEWAISASEECHNMSSDNGNGRDYWFTEPYYSFDLCFVDESPVTTDR
jgi:hypothetical protein